MEHIKVNVASNYFVIGILEEMDLSMKLFELMMPNYFRGLFNAYKGKELDFEIPYFNPNLFKLEKFSLKL